MGWVEKGDWQSEHETVGMEPLELKLGHDEHHDHDMGAVERTWRFAMFWKSTKRDGRALRRLQPESPYSEKMLDDMKKRWKGASAASIAATTSRLLSSVVSNAITMAVRGRAARGANGELRLGGDGSDDNRHNEVAENGDQANKEDLCPFRVMHLGAFEHLAWGCGSRPL